MASVVGWSAWGVAGLVVVFAALLSLADAVIRDLGPSLQHGDLHDGDLHNASLRFQSRALPDWVVQSRTRAKSLDTSGQDGKNYYHYCNICHDHTLCRYFGQGEACRAAAASRPLGRDEQDEVVASHNTMRWVLATGEEPRGSPGPQPPAANMRLMWYDDELADVAQRWADQCQFKHDACRNVERFRVGQNIYLERTTRPLKRPDWDTVTRKWYDEVAKHNGYQTLNSYRFSAVTGHFTQMSWADTFLVGCGISEYQENLGGRRWNTRLYVCNYGPAGNVVGDRMYRTGDACTYCGQDSYCYYGLCV